MIPEGVTGVPENNDTGTQKRALLRHMVRSIVRGVLAGVGGVFIMIGVPVAIMTPFPFVPIGLPIIITGVVLLGRNSTAGRKWMESVMERWPKVERLAPDWLMKLVFGRSKREIKEEAEARTETP